MPYFNNFPRLSDAVAFDSEEEKKQKIWRKAKPILEYDPNKRRMDDYGNVIRYEEYGKQSEFGWEFDHILPQALGGRDEIFNLRPLYWRQNASRGGHLGNQLRR